MIYLLTLWNFTLSHVHFSKSEFYKRYNLKKLTAVFKKAYVVIILTFAFVLVGCSQPEPGPQDATPPAPTAEKTTPQMDPAVATAIANANPQPTSVPETAVTAASANDEQITILSPSATHTQSPKTDTTSSCTPPNGWVEYTIRPLDTLLFLAAQTKVTVESIKSANCKDDDLLLVGENLFLPFVPPILPTVPPPTAIPTAADSNTGFSNVGIAQTSCGLSCAIDELDTFFEFRGGGGTGIPNPCDENKPDAWIDAGDIEKRFEGERYHFFICDLPPSLTENGENLMAILSWSNGEWPLTVRNSLPPIPSPEPAPDMGNAKRVVIWETCNPKHPFPINEFLTLTITDGSGKEIASYPRFKLEPPKDNLPAILVSPQTATPGESFDVLYCGFPPLETFPIGVYSHTDLGTDTSILNILTGYKMNRNSTMHILTDAYGRAASKIVSNYNDPIRLYIIRYTIKQDNEPLEFKAKFWLVEP